MKLLFQALLLWTATQTATGQIIGTIQDENRSPVSFTTIQLLKAADSSFVQGVLSEEDGKFAIKNVIPGKYFMRFSSVGYLPGASDFFEITSDQKNRTFNSFILKQDNQQLGEVVVKGEKPTFEQSTEGIVVNVENSVLTKGSTALQVLERSPGVVIDHRNGGISLNGKDGVMVMLNGKLLRMPLAQVVALLNGTSANDIEKVELLTAPSSRYDADGNAGLINIVTKKNKNQGTTGSVSLNAGYGYREKAAAGFNIARNQGRLSSYASYTFSRDRSYSYMFINSDQNMPVFGGKLNVIMYDTTRSSQNNHNATAGLDYKSDSKTSLGANLSYSRSSSATSTLPRATYTLYPDSILLFSGRVNGKNSWKNLNSSLYFEKETKSGDRINFNADYLYFQNENPSIVSSSFIHTDGSPASGNENLFASSQRGFGKTSIGVGVFKSDFTKKLSDKLRLETGLKATYSSGNSLSGIESLVDGKWLSRSETSNQIKMTEGIGAGYISLNAQFNPRTTLNIGTRYEYAHTRMTDPKIIENSVDRRLGKLFPSISFSKKFDDIREFQLTYSKRISRPSYTDLASYVAYSDPTAVYTGNPSLRPTLTNMVKLGYNLKNYAFALLLSRDNNVIARYQITQRPAANLLYVSPQNVTYQNNITLQANLPFKVNDWWKMSYGFTGGLRQFKVEYTQIPVQKTYFGYSANFNQTIQLPKNLLFEVSGWLNSPSYNGSIKVAAFGSLNAGVKKDLKNNRGTFQLSVTDLLGTMQINSYYGTLTREAFSIKNHVAFNTESRVRPIFKLSFFKSFGGNAGSTSGKANSVSKDEADRLRSN